MIKGPKLKKPQWKLLANAFSHISEAIIIFSLATFFVPEAVGLSTEFSRLTALVFLTGGLTLLWFATILARKG